MGQKGSGEARPRARPEARASAWGPALSHTGPCEASVSASVTGAAVKPSARAMSAQGQAPQAPGEDQGRADIVANAVTC